MGLECGNSARMAGAFLILLATVSPAAAHKLSLFVAVEGPVLTGYAYFTSGSRVEGARILITGPDRAPLADLRSDREGLFRFVARQRVDHTITANSGDGHVAETILKASVFPESLSAGAVGSLPSVPSSNDASASDIGAVIDQSVSRQLRPLREEISAFQNKVWVHDILGGLGVIFGLFGFAYGIAAKRSRRTF